MKTVISIAQIISAVVLIILVLMQDRGEGVGESLGGTQSGGASHTRRGMENTLHITTIIFLILFAATSIGILLV